MFESLSQRFERVFERVRGKPRLSEDNIKEALHEVRLALLEADVSYRVVRAFLDRVSERAVGTEVIRSVTPGQQFVKVVNDELEALMGPVDANIPYAEDRPTVLMLAGLQGSGKTTTCAKLALMVRDQNHRPMMVAADVQRPAAIDQLEALGKQADVPVYANRKASPPSICKEALKQAGKLEADVVIVDTAGRLHIDQEMMEELKQVHKRLEPDQTYLVCDAMTGQDAVNSAKEFNEQLQIDGIILSKLDGDARGGAALSIKSVTGKPILFAGVGEKLDKLEVFRPERMAQRILGMGDVVSLVERAQEIIAEDEAAELEKKLRTERFDFDDFLKQIRAIRKMGPLRDVMGMLPFIGNKLADVELDETGINRVEAVICSMTKQERARPEVIDASRRQRIAKGSGTEPQEVTRLLKQFKQMKKLLHRMTGPRGEELLEAMTNPTELAAPGRVGVMSAKKRLKARAKRKRGRRHRRRR